MEKWEAYNQFKSLNSLRFSDKQGGWCVRESEERSKAKYQKLYQQRSHHRLKKSLLWLYYRDCTTICVKSKKPQCIMVDNTFVAPHFSYLSPCHSCVTHSPYQFIITSCLNFRRKSRWCACFQTEKDNHISLYCEAPAQSVEVTHHSCLHIRTIKHLDFDGLVPDETDLW